jgi:hypothetical protein
MNPYLAIGLIVVVALVAFFAGRSLGFISGYYFGGLAGYERGKQQERFREW